ncbi:ACADL [Symbiodinium pilosum]|uniref:ACADL protein n=1 Tax=Symbiodinium pilosum TaxID=2952 RepID=A0A812YB14_SYMPI|nr:ACADL [Symbiodinium pilosum]
MAQPSSLDGALPVLQEASPRLTRAEVAKHCTADDCWLIVNGRVYDVTGFLDEHPAGRSIVLLHGGKDCTKEFLQVHSEDYILAFAPNSFVGCLEGSGAQPPKRLARAGPVHFNSSKVLALKRTVYGDEHEIYRASFRAFLKRHVLPRYASFEAKGLVDRNVYEMMAREGFYLTLGIPKSCGGLGLDWRHNCVVVEEVEDVGCGGLFVNLGNDMVLSYFTESCTEEQRARWLPKLRRGAVLAVAMSEPEVGSDLGQLSCRAAALPDGGWIVNGRKMWISSGALAELTVVACVTDPSKGAKGISMLVIESDMPGFSCAKRFGKLGKHASDTCLITLEDVKVPRENLVGEEGKGFQYMMHHLPRERLSIAVASMAAARRALALTVNYVNGRAAFGSVLGSLQALQQELAQIRTEVQVGTAFVDRCIADACDKQLTAEGASMAKYFATDLSFRVADRCQQMFGGYGYLKNSPIGKIMTDQRVTRIYGGANEVQLEIIAKGGLPRAPVKFVWLFDAASLAGIRVVMVHLQAQHGRQTVLDPAACPEGSSYPTIAALGQLPAALSADYGVVARKDLRRFLASLDPHGYGAPLSADDEAFLHLLDRVGDLIAALLYQDQGIWETHTRPTLVCSAPLGFGTVTAFTERRRQLKQLQEDGHHIKLILAELRAALEAARGGRFTEFEGVSGKLLMISLRKTGRLSQSVTRHGEALHNLVDRGAGSYERIGSQRIAGTGCLAAAATFSALKERGEEKLDAIVSSTLQRALQTAELSMVPLKADNAPLIALDQMVEIQCDDIWNESRWEDDVRRDWPSWNVEFASSESAHPVRLLDTAESLIRRAEYVWNFLMQLPGSVIGVASHGCFLFFLSRRIAASKGQRMPPFKHDRWQNGEIRRYVLPPTDGMAMAWTEFGGLLDISDFDFYNRYHRRAAFVNAARLRGLSAEVWWLATEWRWARCDSEIEAELEAQAGTAFSLPSFLNAEAIAKHLVVLFSIPCDPESCLQRLFCDFPSLSRYVGLVEERMPGTWPDYSTFMLALCPEDRPPPPPRAQGSVLAAPELATRRPDWWELWGWSWGGRKRPVQFGGPGKAPPAIYAISFGIAAALVRTIF